jgi:tape measure domain-containing protein
MATRDEVLRFRIETQGGKEVVKLANQVTELGDASGEAEKQANALLGEFANTSRLQQAVGQYRELGTAVTETERKLGEARTKVTQLSEAINASAAPTAKQTAEFAKARQELERLGAKQADQRNKLRELRSELDAGGVSATRLATAERELATRSAAVAPALQQMIAALRVARTEEERLAAAKESGRQQTLRNIKSQVDQRNAQIAAGEALRRYKANTDAATAATARLGAEGEKVGGVFGRLRGLFAGALAAVSFAGIAEGIKSVLGLGDAAEKTQKQLARLFGGAEAGAEAFAKLRQIAASNGLPFDDVRAAAVKLKTFGLDPLNGSLQALIDQNAAAGGSQQDLEGKILAVGQAWAKQKLQGEEILQLVERGVPVWDLLAKVTGKSVTELQKLSEAGKLGRAEIAALLKEIGRLNAGAGAEGANSITGLFNTLTQSVRDFGTAIANSGALDAFKKRIRDLIAEINQLANSGKLEQYAKSVSDALTTVANVLFSTTKFIVEHASAIVNLGLAYAAFKTASFVLQVGNATAALLGYQKVAGGSAAATAATATAANATGTAFGSAASRIVDAAKSFGIWLARLVAANPIVTTLVVSVGALVPKLVELAEVNERIAETEAEAARQRQLNLAKIEFLKDAGKDYADTVILQGSEISKLTALEATSYAQRLARAQGYYRGLESEARMAGDAVGLKDAKDHLADIGPALDAVRKHIAGIEEAAARSKTRFSEFGIAAGEAFDQAREKGQKARDDLAKLFNDVDFANPRGIKNIADAFVVVSARGKEAATTIREELRAQILKLSDEDFQKFQVAANKALSEGVAGADKLKVALQGINLARLGVDIEAIKTGLTGAGGAAARSFAGAVEEIKTLGLTAEQQSIAVAQAFDAAFKSASTSKELEALKASLEAAFKRGEIAADAYGKRVSEVNAKIAEQTASNNLFKPVTQNVENLGTQATATAAQLKEIGVSAQDAERKTGDFATRGGAFLQNVAEAIKQTRAEFEAISESAAREFDRLVLDMERVRTSVGAGAGFDTVARNLRIAADETRQAVEGQRATLDAMIQSLEAYGTTAVAAFGQTGGSAADASAQLAVLDQQIKDGTSSFTLLGDEDLQRLQQALESARGKTQALEQQALSAADALRSTADSLRDAIDQANGDQTAVENRRFARQLEEIRAQAELAGELGRQQAAEAERLAQELHEQNIQRIRKEADEKRRRDNGGDAGSNQPTPPTSPTRPNGGGAAAQPPVINNTFILWDEESKQRAARDLKKRFAQLTAIGG